MSKNTNTLEAELVARFDRALDDIQFLGQEELNNLCCNLKIPYENLEFKALIPEEKFSAGLTPAEVKVLITAYYKTIPKGYTYSKRYNAGFEKRTFLFNHKNHQVNKIKQTIQFNLLLASSGRSKNYFKGMLLIINAIEYLKNNKELPYHINLTA
jgi:hypothetical protein